MRQNLWFNIDFTRKQEQKNCDVSKQKNCGGTPRLKDFHLGEFISLLNKLVRLTYLKQIIVLISCVVG